MITRSQFTELVSDAYKHLFDFVHLRTHPLVNQLIQPTQGSAKERGWELHQRLLTVLNEVVGQASAPVHSKEWRWGRILALRYHDGLDPQQVADRLAISKRQYYREHAAALEIIADILWEQRLITEAAPAEALLHHEMSRMMQNDHAADVGEVLHSVVDTLGRIIDAKGIDVAIDVAPAVTRVTIGRMLLRQVLMSVIGHVITNLQVDKVAINAFNIQAGVQLTIEIHPPMQQDEVVSLGVWSSLSPLTDTPLDVQMLTLPPDHGGAALVSGFHFLLPVLDERTLLVIDDNVDILSFYLRCLEPNGYRVLAAQTAAEGLAFVHQTQPNVILLDLMLPEHDGWELMRAFFDEPRLRHIPIIVCSVLKQRDLALALGAAAFLEKPVLEATLLAALNNVLQGRATPHENANHPRR